MSRNRYVADYHLADSLDGRGRIRTDVEYVGALYSFSGRPEEVARAKRKALILCLAGWLFYIGAMILPSAAMRTVYSALPFALAGLPLALLTGTVLELLPRKERFEHRYADRLEYRFPASSAFLLFLCALALAGEAANLFRALEMRPGDLAFALCAAALLACGILLRQARRALACRKVS